MFYSVGIDVSMGKSTIAIISTDGEVISEPFEIEHTKSGFNLVLEKIKDIPKDNVKFVMESTGNYCKSLLKIIIDNGFPIEYTPDVEVIDSEQLEMALKKELASFCYTTLNASLETCYDLVGLDVKDEAEKRKSEKEKGYDEIFTPRMTAYTNSGNKNTTENQGGRPSGTNQEVQGKQNYDQEYNKNARGN